MQFQNLRNSRETEISKFCNAEVNNFCFLKHVVGELCHLLLSVFRSKMHLQYFSIFFQFYIIRFNGYFCKHLWLISYQNPVTLKEWIATNNIFCATLSKKNEKNFVRTLSFGKVPVISRQDDLSACQRTFPNFGDSV